MKTQSSLPVRRGRGELSSPFDMLQNRIDRMFEDFSAGFGMPAMFGNGDFAVSPFLDVHETDGMVTISAEVPGVDEKDIDISVVDKMLTISGEKKEEFERKEGDRYRSERSYGRFSRSISLPFDIDANKVEAKYDRGVLKLSIPKPPEAQRQPRRIAIKH